MAPIALHVAPVPLARPFVDRIPRAKTKKRSTWNEKLAFLAPGLLPDEAEERLRDFCKIFSFRRNGAIVTRLRQGPRAWTANRGLMSLDHIARHLLGDAIPHLAPQWYGARSLATSYFFCLDLDVDRKVIPTQDAAPSASTPVTDITSRSTAGMQKQSLAMRRAIVRQALQRLGIDLDDPSHVLEQTTPSGGRHFYVFFDRPYYLDQYHALLQAAGLTFAKGRIEFFPSEKQGLRLPFGYVPGTPHDPTAWLRFVRSHRFGRWKEFALADLHASLERSTIKTRSVAATTAQSRSPAPSSTKPKRTRLSYLPMPSVTREKSSLDPDAGSIPPLNSPQDVLRLMVQGITMPGTRTAILKVLAAHFIFIRGRTATAAAELLTKWALNSRHESQDIRNDLTNGTDVVTKHIQRMCRWYEEKRKASTNHPSLPNSTGNIFTADEVTWLRNQLQQVPATNRANLTDFLLSFLAFAKQHGKARSDGLAWHAAPAVNQVMRKWPSCHHMNYKANIELATSLGIFQMVRDKWQNPNGAGRARTYELLIPVTNNAASVDFTAAHHRILDPSLDAPGEEVSESVSPPAGTNFQKENIHEHDHANQSKSEPKGDPTVHAAAVHQGHPRGHLAASSRQRPPQPHATQRLRSRRAAKLSATVIRHRRHRSCTLKVVFRRALPLTYSSPSRGPPTKADIAPCQCYLRE